MAIVRDLAGNAPAGVEKPWDSPNRFVTATPVASLTPQYSGEIVQWYDAVTGLAYQFIARGLTNTSWVRADMEVAR